MENGVKEKGAFASYRTRSFAVGTALSRNVAAFEHSAAVF